MSIAKDCMKMRAINISNRMETCINTINCLGISSSVNLHKNPIRGSAVFILLSLLNCASTLHCYSSLADINSLQ